MIKSISQSVSPSVKQSSDQSNQSVKLSNSQSIQSIPVNSTHFNLHHPSLTNPNQSIQCNPIPFPIPTRPIQSDPINESIHQTVNPIPPHLKKTIAYHPNESNPIESRVVQCNSILSNLAYPKSLSIKPVFSIRKSVNQSINHSINPIKSNQSNEIQ